MPDHYLWRKDLSKYSLKSFGQADEIVADTNNGDALTYSANGTNKVITNNTVPVVSGSPATVTLTHAQSGSNVLFDRAAGIIYTLPKPVIGDYFQFTTTVSVTSNSLKIITDAGTTFLAGSVFNAVAAGTGTQFIGDGSTHIALTSSGTTTGGLKGGVFWAYCVSATLWIIDGIVLGSGTIATPFATS